MRDVKIMDLCRRRRMNYGSSSCRCSHSEGLESCWFWGGVPNNLFLIGYKLATVRHANVRCLAQHLNLAWKYCTVCSDQIFFLICEKFVYRKFEKVQQRRLSVCTQKFGIPNKNFELNHKFDKFVDHSENKMCRFVI